MEKLPIEQKLEGQPEATQAGGTIGLDSVGQVSPPQKINTIFFVPFGYPKEQLQSMANTLRLTVSGAITEQMKGIADTVRLALDAIIEQIEIKGYLPLIDNTKFKELEVHIANTVGSRAKELMVSGGFRRNSFAGT